jgi:hypothetical protein
VSRIASSLDDQVRCFHRRPLQDVYEYLILDGVTLRVKGASGAKKCLALCVDGITFKGQRELIDFRLAPSESEREWSVLLESLQRRGLTGDRVALAVTDGGKGLIRALEAVFGDLPLQRCWAHKMRNVANKLKAAQRSPCLKQAAGIYQAANLVGEGEVNHVANLAVHLGYLGRAPDEKVRAAAATGQEARRRSAVAGDAVFVEHGLHLALEFEAAGGPVPRLDF